MRQQPEVYVQQLSLIQQAKVWDAQAQAMGDIASSADSAGYSGNAGYFVDAVNAYNVTRPNIANLCSEAQQQMNEIANALIRSYRAYKDTEIANVQAANKAVH